MVRISLPSLVELVDDAFARRDPTLASWPDPHPDRSPHDEEYSRVTNPKKWRILGARADAWLSTLAGHELATVQPVELDAIRWAKKPGLLMTSAVLVQPHAAGALPMIVARSQIENVPDAGITLGVGDPAVCAGWFPDCGCDACDSGSANDLEYLDRYLAGIVGGGYRRLSRRRQEIVAIGDGTVTATGERECPQIVDILNNPKGWRELTGTSWLG
jgi:hypothetical protein